MSRYVGITGFMSRAEVDACLDALPAGLVLMCGVLVSAKSMRGERNRWRRRYPKSEDIAGIFPDDPRCLNLIHYCADAPPDAATVSRLQTLGGPNCGGFQFNGTWPSAATLAALSGGDVVLQFRPGASSIDTLANTIRGLCNAQPHVLIDGSGGKGQPLHWRQAASLTDDIRRAVPEHVGIGIAGGLCADALPSFARGMLRGMRLSIDAEGRLRDGDEGGTLDLAKARAYLVAAGEIFL